MITWLRSIGITRTTTVGFFMMCAGILETLSHDSFIQAYPKAASAVFTLSGLVVIILRVLTTGPVGSTPK